MCFVYVNQWVTLSYFVPSWPQNTVDGCESLRQFIDGLAQYRVSTYLFKERSSIHSMSTYCRRLHIRIVWNYEASHTRGHVAASGAWSRAATAAKYHVGERGKTLGSGFVMFNQWLVMGNSEKKAGHFLQLGLWAWILELEPLLWPMKTYTYNIF